MSFIRFWTIKPVYYWLVTYCGPNYNSLKRLHHRERWVREGEAEKISKDPSVILAMRTACRGQPSFEIFFHVWQAVCGIAMCWSIHVNAGWDRTQTSRHKISLLLDSPTLALEDLSFSKASVSATGVEGDWNGCANFSFLLWKHFPWSAMCHLS